MLKEIIFIDHSQYKLKQKEFNFFIFTKICNDRIFKLKQMNKQSKYYNKNIVQ